MKAKRRPAGSAPAPYPVTVTGEQALQLLVSHYGSVEKLAETAGLGEFVVECLEDAVRGGFFQARHYRSIQRKARELGLMADGEEIQ